MASKILYLVDPVVSINVKRKGDYLVRIIESEVFLNAEFNIDLGFAAGRHCDDVLSFGDFAMKTGSISARRS